MPADRCHYCLHSCSYHLDNESGLAGHCAYWYSNSDDESQAAECDCVGFLDSTLPDTIEEKRGER